MGPQVYPATCLAIRRIGRQSRSGDPEALFIRVASDQLFSDLDPEFSDLRSIFLGIFRIGLVFLGSRLVLSFS